MSILKQKNVNLLPLNSLIMETYGGRIWKHNVEGREEKK